LAVFSCCCFEFEILSSEVCVWTAVPGLTQVQEQQTEMVPFHLPTSL